MYILIYSVVLLMFFRYLIVLSFLNSVRFRELIPVLFCTLSGPKTGFNPAFSLVGPILFLLIRNLPTNYTRPFIHFQHFQCNYQNTN